MDPYDTNFKTQMRPKMMPVGDTRSNAIGEAIGSVSDVEEKP